MNHCLHVYEFPDIMKLADVSLVFKKNDNLMEENYRPVSVLPPLSKVYERVFGANVICFTMYRLWIKFSYSHSELNYILLLYKLTSTCAYAAHHCLCDFHLNYKLLIVQSTYWTIRPTQYRYIFYSVMDFRGWTMIHHTCIKFIHVLILKIYWVNLTFIC